MANHDTIPDLTYTFLSWLKNTRNSSYSWLQCEILQFLLEGICFMYISWVMGPCFSNIGKNSFASPSMSKMRDSCFQAKEVPEAVSCIECYIINLGGKRCDVGTVRSEGLFQRDMDLKDLLIALPKSFMPLSNLVHSLFSPKRYVGCWQMSTVTEQKDLEIWILFLAWPQLSLFPSYVSFCFKPMVFLEAWHLTWYKEHQLWSQRNPGAGPDSASSKVWHLKQII